MAYYDNVPKREFSKEVRRLFDKVETVEEEKPREQKVKSPDNRFSIEDILISNANGPQVNKQANVIIPIAITCFTVMAFMIMLAIVGDRNQTPRSIQDIQYKFSDNEIKKMPPEYLKKLEENETTGLFCKGNRCK